MVRKKEKKNLWMREKQLKNVPLLLYEDCSVTERELEECKRILENIGQYEKSSSSQLF